MGSSGSKCTQKKHSRMSPGAPWNLEVRRKSRKYWRPLRRWGRRKTQENKMLLRKLSLAVSNAANQSRKMKAEIWLLDLATWKSLMTDVGSFGGVIGAKTWFRRVQERVWGEKLMMVNIVLFEGSREIWEVWFKKILLFLMIGEITSSWCAFGNDPLGKEKLRFVVWYSWVVERE